MWPNLRKHAGSHTHIEFSKNSTIIILLANNLKLLHNSIAAYKNDLPKFQAYN